MNKLKVVMLAIFSFFTLCSMILGIFETLYDYKHKKKWKDIFEGEGRDD